MKLKRSIAGSIGVAVFIIAFVCTVIAFVSSSWLVSDEHVKGARVERLGLWSHCFQSLPDPTDEYQRRFHVGCRWVFDPFTFGYDKIQGFLMPPFIVVTQFFYAITFVSMIVSFVFVLFFFLCLGPRNKHFVKLTGGIAVTLLVSGVCSVIALAVFAVWAEKEGWMLGQDHYYLGWSFYIAVVGCITSFIGGAIFFLETHIQRKKRNQYKDSRLRMESPSHS